MLNLAMGSVTAATYLDRYPMPQLYPFQIDEIVAEERKWREKVILETKSKLEKEKIVEKFREFGGIKRQKVRNLVEKYAEMEKEEKEFFGMINLRENSIRNVGNMQIRAKIDQIKAMIKVIVNDKIICLIKNLGLFKVQSGSEIDRKTIIGKIFREGRG